MVKVETRAIELEEQLEQSVSQVHVAKSKYLLLCYKAQMLKQRLDTGISCDKDIEQRLIYGRKDVLGYIDALLLKR